jgi:hypothetical protein
MEAESMKKTGLTAMTFAGLLAVAPMQAQAADVEVETVFQDAMYGAAIGALLGAGFMLVSNSPTSHWDYIAVGAGAGIIGGVAYGVYSSSRGFAEYEDGEFHLNVPTPKLALHEGRKGTELAMGVDLLRSRF